MPASCPLHWLQCSADAVGSSPAVPAPSAAAAVPAGAADEPGEPGAGPGVQALRPAPTASATAAKARQRLSARSLGEGEIGMTSILPYRPTASDTDRHRFDT
jgi:hypothetical protein